MRLVRYSGSSPYGRCRKRTALLTAAFTKPPFSQLPNKLCIFTFPQAASFSYGHLFRVPRVSAHESFHCISYFFEDTLAHGEEYFQIQQAVQ